MKNMLLIFSFLATALFSCKKSENNVQPTLNGVWVSKDPAMQLTIRNTDGKGDNYSFLDYNKNGNRYLQVRFPKDTSLYIIKGLTKYQLILQDSLKHDIGLNKVAD